MDVPMAPTGRLDQRADEALLVDAKGDPPHARLRRRPGNRRDIDYREQWRRMNAWDAFVEEQENKNTWLLSLAEWACGLLGALMWIALFWWAEHVLGVPLYSTFIEPLVDTLLNPLREPLAKVSAIKHLVDTVRVVGGPAMGGVCPR